MVVILQITRILLTLIALVATNVSYSEYSSEVQQAQEILVQNGYRLGDADGVWGPKTQRALVEFQSDNGFDQTGVLDTNTASRLFGNDVVRIDVTHSCEFVAGIANGSFYHFSSDKEAETAIDRIVAVSGLPKNFNTRAASVNNASAVITARADPAGGFERMILYNQTFMSSLRKQSGSDWPGYAVLAHEIGHHLSGHTLLSGGSRPKIELEADRYAGFILQRLGADLEEAQLVFNVIGSDKATSTHPSKRDRLAAVANGWQAECDRDTSCGSDNKTSVVVSGGNESVKTQSVKVRGPVARIGPISLGPFCSLKYVQSTYGEECAVARTAAIKKIEDKYSDRCGAYGRWYELWEKDSAWLAHMEIGLKSCKRSLEGIASGAESGVMFHFLKSNKKLSEDFHDFHQSGVGYIIGKDQETINNTFEF